MRVLSVYIERTDNLKQIASRNLKLRPRNRSLAKQHTRIADLQEATENAFKLSISPLASAAEIHGEDTDNHIVHVNEYSYFLAEELGMPKVFRNEIRYSARLHDFGKMVVDTAVLKKGGTLTGPERAEMNKQPIHGSKYCQARRASAPRQGKRLRQTPKASGHNVSDTQTWCSCSAVLATAASQAGARSAGIATSNSVT